MSFLRERAGYIIMGAIGVAILAFLVGDGIRYGQPFWSQQQNVIGEVAGESIKYDEFSKKIERAEASFRQQMGGTLNPQMAAYVQDNTWKQEVSTILLQKEVNRLGLVVSKSELNDLVNGQNPDQQIIQNFSDPKTGQFNRSQLTSFLQNIDTQPAEMQAQWNLFLEGIKNNRLSQKYMNLVKNSVYITSLEAREDYSQRNKLANFSYVLLDYASVDNSKVKPTDADYQEYYNENKATFKNEEETRTVDYVVFDAKPSKADSAEIKSNFDKLAADFRASTNDSMFVSINSDAKMPISYIHKGQLDPALDSLVFKAAPGALVGPLLSNDKYRMAKVLDKRSSPDSVKASHILINPATEGGADKAKAKADSIANLIRKGASFSDLAKQFGTDASKDKGGDLGTFGRGAMIPAFEEAVFNGKPGELKVLTTQFGTHVIHIDSQKGSSVVAKVALVEKGVTTSSKTQNDAYTRASAFLTSVKDPDEFDAAVSKAGLRKLTSPELSGGQASIPGIENPRKIAQWAFKANEGDVAEEIFSFDDKYVVAKLTDIRKKGQLPLEKVKKSIEPMVINYAKAKMLNEKATAALSGAANLNAVASKLGKQVVPVQNIVFANPIIPGLSQENKVIGTVFGLKPGKMSKAINGEAGVYVVSAAGFNEPPALTNTYKQKEQMMQMLGQQVPNQAFKALTDKANIKDNRVKFF
ncbi:peptidylprolyl isomerase [Hufsiella ginkgonis]